MIEVSTIDKMEKVPKMMFASWGYLGVNLVGEAREASTPVKMIFFSVSSVHDPCVMKISTRRPGAGLNTELF